MHLTLPAEALPAKLTLNPELRMNDDDYYAFCIANPDAWIERTATGEIVISPSVGTETAYRVTDASAELSNWSTRDGRGKAFGPTAEYILPTGAALSPDASWVSNRRISSLTKAQKRKFPPVCPEFVIEVMSPTDRLKAAKEKMQEWIRAGVDLAWLIDADHQTVYVYRTGNSEPEPLTGITKIAGEGPVAGFELDLADIWAGL
jgi:Uma2 family endonuclease